MNILYYTWNENSAQDVKQAFERLGWNYTEISYSFSNYEKDEVFEYKVESALDKTKAEIMFTFNYFPIISNVCEKRGIPYIAWVYDCPHLTIYSKTIKHECNYLFLFDREMKKTADAMGAVHTFHMPLAVNTHRLNVQLGLGGEKRTDSFKHDVSFVGSLYENNMYNQISYLPEYLKGYFDAGIAAQQKIWGYNIFDDLLDEDILAQAFQYIKMEENPNYYFTPSNILVNMLEQKVTSEERINLLGKAAEYFKLDVFTNSDPMLLAKGVIKGVVSYVDEMPQIFYNSRINVNISLRSITSGIPLRCMDIMGAGGFLLSNYQPELAEFFVPGEEFVYFDSEEDLMGKMEYFLSHEKERMEIAKNGWQKVNNGFSYENRLAEIMDKVFSLENVAYE